MTGILSLVTFLPLVGVAAILLLKTFAPGDEARAARAVDIAGVLSRFQSGYLYHYAFVMLIGVAGLVTYFMLFVR